MQRAAQENLWPKFFLERPRCAPLRLSFLKHLACRSVNQTKYKASTSTGIVGFALGPGKDLLRLFELVFSMAKGLWKTILAGFFSILSGYVLCLESFSLEFFWLSRYSF